MAKTEAARVVNLWPERLTTFRPFASKSWVFLTWIYDFI